MAASACTIAALLLACCLPVVAQPGPQVLEIPARTAFAEPDPAAMVRQRDGSVPRWSGRLNWFGLFSATGALTVTLRLASQAEAGKLRLEFRAQGGGVGQAVTRQITKPTSTLRFGPFQVSAPGYQRLTLSFLGAGKIRAPGLRSLVLEGAAASGAHFSLVERRNAASVHLHYPVKQELRGQVEWFYCEVTPRTDPLWTYYEATGWHRGYFGMQVNSPTERRVIFSVWDAGHEPVSRSKVSRQDQVQLIVKGKHVLASGFGNEGTGGHSHLIVPWKLGGTNGQQQRMCEFHNQWIRTQHGQWMPLMEASFTHDGHGNSTRLDRSGGVLADRFYLATGGDPDLHACVTPDSSGWPGSVGKTESR